MLAMIGGAAAPGQTTAPVATPATQSSAPAAISPAATGSQANAAGATANSATRGSRRAGGRGSASSAASSNSSPANSGGSASGGGAPAAGITGVPRYRAGFHGPAGTPAPDATATIEVTGETKGNGKPDEQATLPGIASFSNGLKAGTPIQVRLQAPVDSGHAKNGDILRGTLVTAVAGAPAGAPVELTVVAAAPAGQMTSAGELSVQVIKINGNTVLSDVVTATGEEGKKIQPDAAPSRGTEAILTPDKPLTLPAA